MDSHTDQLPQFLAYGMPVSRFQIATSLQNKYLIEWDCPAAETDRLHALKQCPRCAIHCEH